MKRLLILMTMIAATISVSARTEKHTELYSVKGTDSLYLDHYAADVEGLRPCMIFVFGGGFATGTRDRDIYHDYYRMLVERGIDVVAIDYRLGMKDVSNPGIFETISLMKSSVRMAVEDLFDATVFVLGKAAEWNIDPNCIIASGSSAGAITVLQAENNICNRTDMTRVLPEGFNYAGIISFAGAIYSTSGKPEWKGSPAPILLFHGNSDMNVPYRKAVLLGIGFYGSDFIAEQLSEMRSPYLFYSVKYEDHYLAETPMTQNLDTISAFIDDYVIGGARICKTEYVEFLDRPVRKTDFSLFDYIGSNYGEE